MMAVPPIAHVGMEVNSGSIIRAGRATKIAMQGRPVTRHKKTSPSCINMADATTDGLFGGLPSTYCFSTYGFTTCRLLVTEKVPETLLARRPARFLSRIAVHDAFQGHMTVLDNDADGLLDSEFIFLKPGKAINRAKQPQTQAVIHWAMEEEPRSGCRPSRRPQCASRHSRHRI